MPKQKPNSLDEAMENFSRACDQLKLEVHQHILREFSAAQKAMKEAAIKAGQEAAAEATLNCLCIQTGLRIGGLVIDRDGDVYKVSHLSSRFGTHTVKGYKELKDDTWSKVETRIYGWEVIGEGDDEDAE